MINKESKYVICSNCKSTINVNQDTLEDFSEYNNLSTEDFYLLLAKENSFNPFLYPINSPFFLEKNFEKLLEEKRERIANWKDPLFYKGDEYLYQTVKNNEMNITQKYISGNNFKK